MTTEFQLRSAYRLEMAYSLREQHLLKMINGKDEEERNYAEIAYRESVTHTHTLMNEILNRVNGNWRQLIAEDMNKHG